MKKLIIIIITILNLSSCNSEMSPESQKMLAYNYAEDFVKERLKSPSTATFPNIFEKSMDVSTLDYVSFNIRSWVDSQNGFGAIVRNNFSCVITIQNDIVSVSDMLIY